MHNKVKQ